MNVLLAITVGFALVASFLLVVLAVGFTWAMGLFAVTDKWGERGATAYTAISYLAWFLPFCGLVGWAVLEVTRG